MKILIKLNNNQINQWCENNFGKEIMDKTQTERNDLYKFYYGCKFLAENDIHLQFKQGDFNSSANLKK